MSRRLLFQGFLMVLVALGGLAPTPGRAQNQATTDWENFRKDFPLHLQTMALSSSSKDGRRTLIVAEPPPDATLEGIKAAAPTMMVGAIVKQHPIGVDGWVKDVIVSVPANSASLAAEITSLNAYLFGTAYKAHVLDLPVRKDAGGALNLDVRIGAHELREWLGAKAKFRSLGDETAVTLSEISRSARTQVWYSAQPGLVLWWIPTGTKLSEHRGVIRQFAVDSDLLVGGLIREKGVLIIARERTTPLHLVQPIRAETLILLANVRAKELSQSYERNYPLANRYDGKNDWAPILLSPELRHTEYGSLLNITDQLLKGWSSAGLVEYRNFPYPAPSHFPFTDPINPTKYRPLMNLLGERFRKETDEDFNSLVYNWNTVGAGYALVYPKEQIYAMNRTGALPVTYIPEGIEQESAGSKIVLEAMETGYAWFASLDDSYLAKVFQYASLYQLFRAASDAGKWSSTDEVFSHTQPELELRRLFSIALKELMDNPKIMAVQSAKRRAEAIAGELAEKEKELVDFLSETKNQLAQYSAKALTEELVNLEKEEAIQMLLLEVKSYEREFQAHPANKLRPLDSKAKPHEMIQQALERAAELSTRDDAWWDAFEATAKEIAGEPAWSEFKAERFKAFRESASKTVVTKDWKHATPDAASEAKQEALLELRSRLRSAASLRTEPKSEPKSESPTFEAILALLKPPKTEETMVTAEWLQTLTTAEMKKVASNQVQSRLRAQDAAVEKQLTEQAESLSKWPAAAIDMTVSLLDQAQPLPSRISDFLKLAESLPNRRDDIMPLRELVTKCGRLVSQVKSEDFVTGYPQAVTNQSSRWIKTPCIVISTPHGEFKDIYGGHNVDSTVTIFDSSNASKLKPGKVSLIEKNGEHAVAIHPDDAAKIPEQVRLAASRLKAIKEMEERGGAGALEKAEALRKRTVAELQTRLEKAKVFQTRPQLTALRAPPGRNPLNRGAVPPNARHDGGPATWSHGTWGDFGSAPPSLRSTAANLREAGPPSIVVRREADGSIQMISPPSNYIKAGNTQSAVDFCATEILEGAGGKGGGGGTVRIHLDGFNESENHAFFASVRTRTKGQVEGMYGLKVKGDGFKKINESMLAKVDVKASTLTFENIDSGVKGVIEFPLMGGGKGGRLTVTVRIKNATKDLLNKITEQISALFENLKIRGAVDRDALFQLDRDVRALAKDYQDSSVTTQFQSEMADFHMAGLPEETAPRTAMASR